MGKHAFSEVEVKEVAGFIEKHPEINMYLTYHNAGQKYIIPWGYTFARVPDYDELVGAHYVIVSMLLAINMVQVPLRISRSPNGIQVN